MEKLRRQWCVETDKIRVEVTYLGKRQREISVFPLGSKEPYFTQTLGEDEVHRLIRALN
tara:strand:- start:287 stop:463 length:177 start_codon:yes stop_codon:yes gene_type:complete